MRYTAVLAFALFLLPMVAPSRGGEAIPTLKDAFKGDFHIGAALGGSVFDKTQEKTLKLVTRQFNTATTENMLKWGPFNPRSGVYRHAHPDRFVDFCDRHDFYTVGHVLFWHQQTPKWVFEDAAGRLLDRDALLARMRAHVRHIAQRYGSRIDAWDVVNESILGNGKLRESMWTRIIGKDFIEQAFRIADEEMPADVELIYNDFGMTAVGKRDAVTRMVRDLKKKGVRIDGVGMQGHWSLDGPSVAQIEASIVAFSETGVQVHVTELDIDVLPRKPGMSGADVGKRYAQDPLMDPYRDGLPHGVQEKQAKRYAEIFALFLKHRNAIKRVTFWGVTDRHSWLNNSPVKGRTNYPLLFDRRGEAKPAFNSVLQLKEAPGKGNTRAPSEEAPEESVRRVESS